jgi:CheY-like chemotaxis protein
LIVEDNPDMNFLMQHVLQESYDVEAVTGYDDAVGLARQRRFDLILMDINLGSERTGIDVLHELRRLPDYLHVPTVAITAYALPGDREQFIGSGFDGYMPKPFAVEELLDLISTTLTEHHRLTP